MFYSDYSNAGEIEQFDNLLYAVSQRRHEVLNHLTSQHHGKWVAVDLVTGEYELDDDPAEAERKLEVRMPRATAWMFEVPDDYVHKMYPYLNGIPAQTEEA